MANTLSALSLKRLFQKAGIYRVSNDSNSKLYFLIEETISNILDKSYAFSKKNVLNSESIEKGYLISNILNILDNQAGGGNDNYCDDQPSQCGGNRPFCDGDISQCGMFSEEVVQACREQQTGGDNYFSIPKTQFGRLVSDTLENHFITKSGINTLQLYVEKSIINYLANLKANEKIFKL